MNKALIALVGILFVGVLVAGYWVHKERDEKNALGMQLATLQSQKPKAPAVGRAMPLFKGAKFADNPISQKAYLIAPVTGNLSADAQKALTGWTVKSTDNGDGTTTVNLIPKEAEDVQQSFTLKSGYKLYFIEMNLADDATGVDENRGDDMGVLVDQNGIVQ